MTGKKVSQRSAPTALRRFARRLRVLLDRDNVSEEQLAETLRLSPKTISSWCRGRSFGQGANLIQLSSYFGVSLDWLVGGVGEDDDPFLAERVAHNEPVEPALARELKRLAPAEIEGLLLEAEIDARRAIEICRAQVHAEAYALEAEHQRAVDALNDPFAKGILTLHEEINVVASALPGDSARKLKGIADRLHNGAGYLFLRKAMDVAEAPLTAHNGGMLLRTGPRPVDSTLQVRMDLVGTDVDTEAWIRDMERSGRAIVTPVRPGAGVEAPLLTRVIVGPPSAAASRSPTTKLRRRT